MAVITTSSILLACVLAPRAIPGLIAPSYPRFDRPVEVSVRAPKADRGPAGAWTDRDGPWPGAGVTVFRIDDVTAARDAGLEPTRRPGWFLLPDAEVEAKTPKALAARALARYATPGLVDRLGGLAWPDAAMLVGFRPNATLAERDAALAAAGGAAERYAALPDLVLVRLEVATGQEVLARVAAVAGLPGVAFAEPDLAITGRSSLVPTDPLFGSSWGHRNTGQDGGLAGFDLRSTNAWDLGTGDGSIRVLVIDTGVQSNHPDLLVEPGRDFTTGALDGVPGGDPVNSFESHGTAVAGCVSGRVDNGLGTCGMAPGCPTVSARCFVGLSGGSWDANYSWTANALNWALAHGILITNNSNWYGGTSAAVEAAYAATRQAGAIHFASAGNSGNTAVTYPASLGPVLAIGAAQRSGTRATFSCFGPLLDCLAPGASIVTTDRTGPAGYNATDYTTVNGTSFASPLAAGVAALMRSRDPSISPDTITEILFSTARDLESAGYDPNTGWGLIDAFAAVSAVGVSCPPDLDGDGATGPGDLAILLGSWGLGGSGDLDGSGSIDPADLATMLAAWGSCPG
jgi:subtilisin family serine protease